MYDLPPAVGLHDLLCVIVAEHPRRKSEERHAEIRRRVYALVDDLKSAGSPPERAILVVKQIAFDAGMTPTRGVFSLDPLTEQDAAIAEMVRWTVERYFDVSLRPT